MKAIIVLGADRVGKSTIIRNTARSMEAGDLKVRVSHFSEIKPHHHSPIQQFEEEIENYKDLDVVIMDRFVSDTLFYETYRGQMSPISPEFALTVESKVLKLFERISVCLLNHPWDQTMISRHKEEILNNNLTCTPYWMSKQIERISEEHKHYYEHTKNYLDNWSLITKAYGYSNLSNSDYCRPSYTLSS